MGAGNSAVVVDVAAMWADADSSCTESCTDSWRHWLGSLCGQAARRTSRSSSWATNSACCAARSTDPRSPTPTGARSGRVRPRYRDRAEPGGWSPPTRCCVGTAAASPGTGLNYSDRRAGHRPQRSFADSRCASQRRIQPGDIAASGANSPGSATASLRPRSGEILKDAGIDPAPTRSEVTWSQFLRSQTAVACDFTTIETVTLRRFYLLLCIDIATRTVYIAGTTGHPSGVWGTQGARNLLLQYGHQLADAQALVRDRANQFIDASDEIFRTERMKILKTPVRTPVANAFAERWIATPRRELLDRTIIGNRRQLNKLVVDYIDHYNTHRPHRSLDQRPPVATDPPDQPDRHLQAVKTARCDGPINEYRNAARPATTQFSAPTRYRRLRSRKPRLLGTGGTRTTSPSIAWVQVQCRRS